jgi:hypothetical protein
MMPKNEPEKEEYEKRRAILLCQWELKRRKLYAEGKKDTSSYTNYLSNSYTPEILPHCDSCCDRFVCMTMNAKVFQRIEYFHGSRQYLILAESITEADDTIFNDEGMYVSYDDDTENDDEETKEKDINDINWRTTNFG